MATTILVVVAVVVALIVLTIALWLHDAWRDSGPRRPGRRDRTSPTSWNWLIRRRRRKLLTYDETR